VIEGRPCTDSNWKCSHDERGRYCLCSKTYVAIIKIIVYIKVISKAEKQIHDRFSNVKVQCKYYTSLVLCFFKIAHLSVSEMLKDTEDIFRFLCVQHKI